LYYDPDSHTEESLKPILGNEPQPEADLSLKLMRDYESAQDGWATEAQANYQFVYNGQWTKEQEERLVSRGQAPIAANVLYPAVEQVISMLTHNPPRFHVSGREDSDVKTAKAFSELLSHVWQRSRADVLLKRAAFDYVVMGRGVMMAYIDPEANLGRGEVMLKDLDPLMVYPDPNARDPHWRDASHILVKQVMTTEQVLSIWPNAKEMLQGGVAPAHRNIVTNLVSKQILPGDEPDGGHDRHVIIERQSRVRLFHIHFVDTLTGREELFLPEEEDQFLQRPAYLIMQIQEGQIVGEQPVTAVEEQGQILQMMQQGQPMEDGGVYVQIPPQNEQEPPQEMLIYQVDMAYMVEREIVMRRQVRTPRIKIVITIDDKVYYDGYLPTEHYTIVPLVPARSRNPYPTSDIGIVRPMQETRNKMLMQVLANVATSNNQKVLFPRGSMDRKVLEEELSKAGTAALEYDAEMGAPVILGPQPVPVGLFTMFEGLGVEIKDVLGVYGLSQGNAKEAPDTYRGTLAIDEFGQRRLRGKAVDVEHGLAQLGYAVMQLCQAVYTGERALRIVQPNNIVRETVINQLQYDDLGVIQGRINDITVGEYDLVLLSGSTLPSSRWALDEYYRELYQYGLIDQVEVLKKSELVDAEAVLERMGHIAHLQSQLQQAQEEIKRLSGDLQTAERAEVNSRKRVEVEKFKGELAVQGAQLQAEAALQQGRMGMEEAMHGERLSLQEAKYASNLQAQAAAFKAQTNATTQVAAAQLKAAIDRVKTTNKK